MPKKLLLAAVPVLVLMLVVVGARYRSHVDERWRVLAQRADALESKLVEQDVPRPVLYGTGTSALAQPLYEQALAEVAADLALEEAVRPHERAKRTRSEREALLAEHASIPDLVHRGAHATRVAETADRNAGLSGQVVSLLAARGVTNLMVDRALLQIDAGEHVAAAETLLDAAQMAGDFMNSPSTIEELIGAALLHIATSEAVGRNDLLAKLEPEALDRLSSGLAVLDARLGPVGPSLLAETVCFARKVTGPGFESEPPVADSIEDLGFVFGIDARRQLAEQILVSMQRAERITEVATNGTWSDVERLDSAYAASNAGVDLRNLGGYPLSLLSMRWTAIARIRMLRMAIEHTLGRSVPALDDPFGAAPLRFATSPDGSATFSSVGPDGDGLGLFEHRP